MSVPLPSHAGMQTIVEIHAQLRAAFAKPGPVAVDPCRFKEGDLSIVQLFAAARLQAAAQGREIRLTEPANAALADLLDRSGLAPSSEADRAFWLHAEDRP